MLPVVWRAREIIKVECQVHTFSSLVRSGRENFARSPEAAAAMAKATPVLPPARKARRTGWR